MLHVQPIKPDPRKRPEPYLWTLAYEWAKHSHQNKSREWVFHRYFGEFNKSRRDRWVLGDRDSGAY